MAFPLCLSVSWSPFLLRTLVIRLCTTHTTLFYLNYLFNGPVSKDSCILNYWGVPVHFTFLDSWLRPLHSFHNIRQINRRKMNRSLITCVSPVDMEDFQENWLTPEMTQDLPYTPSVKEPKVKQSSKSEEPMESSKSFMNLGSILPSKQRGAQRTCMLWKTFIGRNDRTRLISKSKRRIVSGKVTPLRGGQGSYQSGCLSFPWGMKRAHRTDNLICTDQKIPDWC